MASIWQGREYNTNFDSLRKSESDVEEGEVIGELLLDQSGISSSSNLRELTLREQSPIRAPAATCKSPSGQLFKTTQLPPLQNDLIAFSGVFQTLTWTWI